jgi:hypothetical protein
MIFNCYSAVLDLSRKSYSGTKEIGCSYGVRSYSDKIVDGSHPRDQLNTDYKGQ